MIWKYESFIGDPQIYAICPVCGFGVYPSGLSFGDETMECDIKYQLNYCPICGEYLRNNYSTTARVIWKERSVTDLYKMRRNCNVLYK